MTAHDDALSERECWELLATVSVGRLALSVRALPVILPVQYYLDGGRLAVCLGHHALPERALDETIIAFAADSIDPVTRSGWAVQVQGRSVVPAGSGSIPTAVGPTRLRWWRSSRGRSAATGCTCAVHRRASGRRPAAAGHLRAAPAGQRDASAAARVSSPMTMSVSPRRARQAGMAVATGISARTSPGQRARRPCRARGHQA